MQTRVGYAGGVEVSPTYRSIGGHAEVVRVIFDRAVFALEDLMALYLTRAGHGVVASGQYRAEVFPRSVDQAAALARVLEGSAVPIAPAESPESIFWEAEDYHQKYVLRRNSGLVALLSESLGPRWDEHLLATKLNAVGERGFDLKPWLEEMPAGVAEALRKG